VADIAEWLVGLGLRKYAAIFAAHEIDLELVRLLTEDDVRELGLPIGPRRKLLHAIAALRGDTAPAPVPSPAPERRDEAERRHLTVMFVDLASSTNLSTRLDPEAMRDVLRAYQNAVAGEIGRVGGHVAKLMGDGVLAYFGWPRAHEDDAERAVRAGLGAAAVVGGLTSPVPEKLACRVGIATGLVVVGDLIGEGAAQEHAVVGVTPNLAARLQQAAGPDEVVIAASTRRPLGSGFVIEELGEQLLKGHEEPAALFRVLREERRESRFATRTNRGLGPIVGRETELAALLRAWDRAKSGTGKAVVLVGEVGIGKSRLVQALTDAIAADAVANDLPTRRFYQCSELYGGHPLWPIAQQLAHDSAIGAEVGAPGRKARLIRFLSGRVADPERASALLMPLLFGAPEQEAVGAPQTPPQRQRHQRDLLGVLVEEVSAVALTSPALVVFEDAQWADRATLDFLRALVGAIAEAPILLVITARAEGEPRLDPAPHLSRLPLARLDPLAAAALIGGITAARPLAGRLGNEILVRSDGIPLYIEEMTKAVIEAAPGGAPVEVPATLRDSLIARLDIAPAMKAAAQVAACIGRDFDAGLLESIADIAADELRDGLAGLLNAGLVFAEGEGCYRFKHALIRDTAYETLLTPRRQKLHQRIAEAIEALPGDQAQAEPELLALHWFAAGQNARAEAYWLRAQHRATHWQGQLEALADYLDSADPGDADLAKSPNLAKLQ
jgi:class 3 adenylate cyclase